MKQQPLPGTRPYAISAGHLTGPRDQRGVVLLITLIALVAMTLAAIALIRSVDTGNVVAGNLAFKQSATLAGDFGTETAATWLQGKSGTSDTFNDDAANGYYATSQDTLDMTGSTGDPNRALVDWDFNNCNGAAASACIFPSQPIDAGAGNQVNYIINRLCQSAGDSNSTSNSCVTFISETSLSPKRGEIKAGEEKRFESTPVAYYRITSRIKGPRNTISYIETIVHF